MSAEIRVRGEGEVRCLPNRASLRISVEAEAESQAEAFTLASRSAATVDAVLDRYGEAIDRRFTAGVLVRPKTRLRKGETITTAWIAGRTTVVEVKAFSEVGRIVGELPGAGASAVFGPNWEVNSANVAHEQARRSAAIDAQLRATAYADAVHLKLGALKWLAEPGLRRDTSPGPIHGPAARFYAAGAVAPPQEPMDIERDEVTIHATVDACFELLDVSQVP